MMSEPRNKALAAQSYPLRSGSTRSVEVTLARPFKAGFEASPRVDPSRSDGMKQANSLHGVADATPER